MTKLTTTAAGGALAPRQRPQWTYDGPGGEARLEVDRRRDDPGAKESPPPPAVTRRSVAAALAEAEAALAPSGDIDGIKEFLATLADRHGLAMPQGLGLDIDLSLMAEWPADLFARAARRVWEDHQPGDPLPAVATFKRHVLSELEERRDRLAQLQTLDVRVGLRDANDPDLRAGRETAPAKPRDRFHPASYQAGLADGVALLLGRMKTPPADLAGLLARHDVEIQALRANAYAARVSVDALARALEEAARPKTRRSTTKTSGGG